jgi:hypothetical protein
MIPPWPPSEVVARKEKGLSAALDANGGADCREAREATARFGFAEPRAACLL